jgi:DNA-binding NtrC family response regulator
MNSMPSLPLPVEQSSSLSLAHYRLLVVDDDLPMLRAVTKVLSRAGAQVWSACSTAEAMALMSDPHLGFDVVLTDLRMPVTSGKFILSVIKSTHPSLPVLIMSAYWTQETKDECTRLGVAECLDKPITSHALVQAINRVMRGELPKN